jgi:4-alpha-glucanotransferase
MNPGRASGLLLHPTSLPNRFGIGDLGPEAYRFVDWLRGARQRVWQILPLSQAGEDGSPYQSLSVMAGNPLLISLDLLADDDLLTGDELDQAAVCDGELGRPVDFNEVAGTKCPLLEKAAGRFAEAGSSDPQWPEFEAFCAEHAYWLDDHAQFLALREANHSRAWTQWEHWVDDNKRPVPQAADALRSRVDMQKILQYFFYRHWNALRRRANEYGIRIVGDLPIYVAHDSVDVWAHRDLFLLDEAGNPTVVAGVPPDYFSSTGQLWNNPIYDWELMRQRGYGWWIQRIEAVLEMVDVCRLDHFRGFKAYWSIPAGEPTAQAGCWVEGPGADFFNAVRHALADRPKTRITSEATLPFIAENLGVITEDVTELQLQFGLPGMQVLQFIMESVGREERALDPFDPNTVVYTGTHDNDTTIGWYESVVVPDETMRQRLARYVKAESREIGWEFIELAWRSAADVAVAPLQDVLCLGGEARMNKPGTNSSEFSNWSWRYRPDALTPSTQRRLADLTLQTQRTSPIPADETVESGPA